MMNADAFRHLYAYHFAENRKIWEAIMLISSEQFTRPTDYAHGSIQNQIVHLMSVDDTWFCGLRGDDIPEPLNAADFPNRERIRAHWDAVEQRMRDYLASLRDDMLFDTPLEGEDHDLMVWQVLCHVVNHGTDHRAQILRLLHDLGIRTTSQDYVFYAYEHPFRAHR